MFYQSMALSLGTKVAALAVSSTTGSMWHPWSPAPEAPVTSHRHSPRAGAAFPLSPEPAFLPAGMSCCAAVPSHNSLSKGDTNSLTTGSFQKQTSWVTFHARNAINAHPGLQSYRFQLS